MKIIDVITSRLLLIFPEICGKFQEVLNFILIVTTVASPRAAILILRVVVRRWCDPDQLNASTVKRKGNHTSERF